jgi:hypothetical protein
MRWHTDSHVAPMFVPPPAPVTVVPLPVGSTPVPVEPIVVSRPALPAAPGSPFTRPPQAATATI